MAHSSPLLARCPTFAADFAAKVGITPLHLKVLLFSLHPTHIEEIFSDPRLAPRIDMKPGIPLRP